MILRYNGVIMLSQEWSCASLGCRQIPILILYLLLNLFGNMFQGWFQDVNLLGHSPPTILCASVNSSKKKNFPSPKRSFHLL